jgi:anti-anti-sigma factor
LQGFLNANFIFEPLDRSAKGVDGKVDSDRVVVSSRKKADMDLQISLRKSGKVTIVDLRGRIMSGPTGDSFKAELRRLAESTLSDVLINLAEVTQMDSSGIGALIQSYVMLTRGGASLKLLNPVGKVLEVLEVTHLNTALAVYADEASALASFRDTTRDA